MIARTRTTAVAAALVVAVLLVAAFVLSPAGNAYAQGPAPLASGGSRQLAETQSPADGWGLDGNVWRYYRSGAAVAGEWVATSEAPAIVGAATGAQRYWIAQDGTLAIGRLVNPSSANDAGAGIWAYATSGGNVATGKTVVGDKVYLAKSNGELERGNAKGWLVTSAYDGSKQRYYIDKTAHAAITGKPVHVAGFGKVYSMAGKGYVVRGVQRIDKTHVLVADKNGKLYHQKRGWANTSTFTKGSTKHRYYFERTKKGKGVYGARTGLFKVKGTKYYGKSKGYIVQDKFKKVKGKYYYIDKKGALTKGAVLSRMIRLAQGYSSPTRYLIMVDTDDTKVIVFEGSRGNWKPKHFWNCVTGALSTPTVLGTFSVGAKGYSFGEDHGYSCYYWTQFYGNYLFHTRLYYPGTRTLQDPLMNARGSMGCVRLLDANALWIQRNAPTGTTVVTMT